MAEQADVRLTSQFAADTEVLRPPVEGPAGPENARSLVLLVRRAGHTLLLAGDGRYEAVGLYDAGELKALEIEFIGPEQDKILEAFPILRY